MATAIIIQDIAVRLRNCYRNVVLYETCYGTHTSPGSAHGFKRAEFYIYHINYETVPQ